MLVSGYAVLLVFWVQPKRVTGEHRVDRGAAATRGNAGHGQPMAATLDPRVEEVPGLVVESASEYRPLRRQPGRRRNPLSPEPGTPGRSGCVQTSALASARPPMRMIA